MVCIMILLNQQSIYRRKGNLLWFSGISKEIQIISIKALVHIFVNELDNQYIMCIQFQFKDWTWPTLLFILKYEIDKTMIAFEFSLIELLSILNFTKSWALMKMINLSRLFYIPNQYLIQIYLLSEPKKSVMWVYY